MQYFTKTYKSHHRSVCSVKFGFHEQNHIINLSHTYTFNKYVIDQVYKGLNILVYVFQIKHSDSIFTEIGIISNSEPICHIV